MVNVATQEHSVPASMPRGLLLALPWDFLAHRAALCKVKLTKNDESQWTKGEGSLRPAEQLRYP